MSCNRTNPVVIDDSSDDSNRASPIVIDDSDYDSNWASPAVADDSGRAVIRIFYNSNSKG